MAWTFLTRVRSTRNTCVRNVKSWATTAAVCNNHLYSESESNSCVPSPITHPPSRLLTSSLPNSHQGFPHPCPAHNMASFPPHVFPSFFPKPQIYSSSNLPFSVILSFTTTANKPSVPLLKNRGTQIVVVMPFFQ